MIIDDTINKNIASVLLQKDADNNHEHSGRLMASSLGMPTLWQVLSAINVPSETFDAYTLAKFKRGRDVEETIVKYIPGVVTKQKELILGRAKGFADVIVDTKDYQFKCGIIPIEVKSVTNAKFKRISTQGADIGHRMQGGYYGIVEKTENFGVLYVASDDYRTLLMIYNTSEIEKQIREELITYDNIFEKKRIPAYSSKMKWHDDPKYSKYKEWNTLTSEQIMKKLQTEFPENYKFFMNL